MNFRQFLAILRARSGLIFIVTLAALAAAASLTMLLPKRYEATASVVVDPKSANPVGGAQSPFVPTADSIVSTHLDILGSPNVALRVVDTLKLEADPRAEALLAEAGPLARLREFASNLFPDEEAEPPGSRRDWMANRLLHHLQLNARRQSRLIKVTYASSDAEFSAVVANAFVRAYLESLLQLRVNPVKQGESRFDKQLKELKGDLEEAQNKVTKFQQEKGIVATDERMDVENVRLADLSAQLVAAQGQTYASQARQRQLRAFLATGRGETPAEVLNSPVVRELKQEISQREAKINELSKRIGPNHPLYRSAEDDLVRLKKRLNEEMRTAGEGYLADSRVASQSESAIRATLARQRAKVFRLKADRSALAMLMQDADSAQRAYNNALDRYTQAKVQSDIDSANGSILDSAAVPTRPVSPKLSVNLAIALAVGIMLGVGAALYRETANRYVRSEQDLVEFLDLPVLAVLTPKRAGQQSRPQLNAPRVYALPRA
jgi:succinoglycan biosynthesis transport protein ExoP